MSKVQNPKSKVQNYACWLLARRDYSAKELLEKFKFKFKLEEKIFKEVLEKLQGLGLQSDARFVENFILSHFHWGRQRLIFELQKKGIIAELIQQNLPTRSAEIQRCKEVLQIKLRCKSMPNEYIAKQKLFAFLARRGFELEIIKESLKSEV